VLTGSSTIQVHGWFRARWFPWSIDYYIATYANWHFLAISLYNGEKGYVRFEVDFCEASTKSPVGTSAQERSTKCRSDICLR